MRGTIKKNGPKSWKGERRYRAASLAAAFAAGSGMALAWGVISHLFSLERILGGNASSVLYARPLFVQIALYGIASPVAEEYIFRKLLYDYMVRITRPRYAALIVSVLFALWHADAAQMLYAFWAGLILQYLRTRSGRMEESILCHMGANLTAIFITAIQT